MESFEVEMKEQELKVSFEATVKIPSLPNFIKINGRTETSVPVQDFSDDELRKIGEAWTEALIAIKALSREKGE